MQKTDDGCGSVCYSCSLAQGIRFNLFAAQEPQSPCVLFAPEGAAVIPLQSLCHRPFLINRRHPLERNPSRSTSCLRGLPIQLACHQHPPQADRQVPGHAHDRFLWQAGVVHEPVVDGSGTWVLRNPWPSRVDQNGPDMPAARLADRPVAPVRSVLTHAWGQPEVSGHFAGAAEPAGLMQLGAERHRRHRTHAGMTAEHGHRSGVVLFPGQLFYPFVDPHESSPELGQFRQQLVKAKTHRPAPRRKRARP